jgi:hypothetical protein
MSDLARPAFKPTETKCERCEAIYFKRRPWARFCSPNCKNLHADETAAANARDAARYHVLRKLRGTNPFEVVYWADNGPVALHGVDLDVAVDAAMATKS